MNKFLRYISLAIACTIALCTMAQDGTTGYQFLNVSPSTHVYGLGGHNISTIDDDVNLIDQNPALLGPEIDKQIGLNYMRYLGATNFMGARFGAPIREHNAWAVGVQYYGYGTFNGYDIAGASTGTFSANDIAISGTYSHDISSRWRGGISLKVITSSYESYSALAVATDLGVNYYNEEKDLSFSAVIKNLGGQLKKFTDQSVNLPWDIQLGITTGLGSTPLHLSITATNLRKWKLPYFTRDGINTDGTLIERNSFMGNLFRHLTFGIEYTQEKFYIGLGYDYKTRTDMTTYSRSFVSGFSLGAGIKVKAFGVGIALAQPHTGATTFMLNLNTTLGELLH